MKPRPVTTVAIVGAGFAGTVLAWHLASAGPKLRLLLIDAATPGRGLAYQAHFDAFLLNVPAARMGAIAGQAEHFWHWLQARGRECGPQDFVSRAWYGEYLEDVLKDARQRARQAGTGLDDVRARVCAIRQTPTGLQLELDQGRDLDVAMAVLATGNLLPADPPAARRLSEHAGYFRSPWQPGAWALPRPHEPILLLGTGLTMADVAMGLRHAGFSGPLYALSRHGLLPQAQIPPGEWPNIWRGPLSPVQWLNLLRREFAAAQAQGLDARVVVDALRPETIRIWQGWSTRQRRAFLRHLRAAWGSVRHRLPAEIAGELARWRLDGSLQILAGTLLDFEPLAAGLKLSWRARGSDQIQHRSFQRVINCTGPGGDYLQDALWASLSQAGLMCPDGLGLGVAADAAGALLNAAGVASDRLFTLGNALRGRDWEATAVPELREQAAQLASHLLARIQGVSRRPSA